MQVPNNSPFMVLNKHDVTRSLIPANQPTDAAQSTIAIEFVFEGRDYRLRITQKAIAAELGFRTHAFVYAIKCVSGVIKLSVASFYGNALPQSDWPGVQHSEENFMSWETWHSFRKIIPDYTCFALDEVINFSNEQTGKYRRIDIFEVSEDVCSKGRASCDAVNYTITLDDHFEQKHSWSHFLTGHISNWDVEQQTVWPILSNFVKIDRPLGAFIDKPSSWRADKSVVINVLAAKGGARLFYEAIVHVDDPIVKHYFEDPINGIRRLRQEGYIELRFQHFGDVGFIHLDSEG